MPELGWTWGVLPSPIKAEEKEVAASLLESSQEQVKDEDMHAGAPKSEPAPIADTTDTKPDASYQEQSSSLATPPPSRIRIYFHTPVSPDDSHPIPHNASYTAPPDMRKGKRKKLEDDDGDAEEGRERPPPPRSSQIDDNISVDLDGVGRGSAAPSVAETASEGDWLMAAIAEDEGADADVDVATTVDDMDEEESHVASVPHFVPATNTFLNGNGEFNLPYFSLWVDAFELGGSVHSWLKAVQTNAYLKGSHSTDMDGIASSGGVHEQSDGSHAGDNHDTVPNAEGVEPSASSDVAAVDLGVNHGSAVATQPNVDILVSALEEGGDVSPATQPVDDENVDKLFDASATLADPSHAIYLSSSFDTSSSTGHGSPPVVQSDMPHSEKQSADHAGYLDTQVSNTQISGAKPLQTEASLASTIPDEDMGVGAYSEDQVVLELTGEIPVEHEEITMHAKAANESADQEHLPEPPASPTSNTLLSTSSGSTYGEPSHPPASTAVSKGGPVPSANRLSISYAAGSRRLVVDAEVVEYLKVYRSEGRIEVHISLDKGSDDGLKGVLVRLSVCPLVCCLTRFIDRGTF
jgi:20S proteasome subunit alpha 6